MVKLRSICQAVNDIRASDPGTAMTEGFLRLLIENGDVSYEICGSRVCLNIAILFKELACLFELESAAMPKLRTIKGALKEIKATDPGSVMTDYKIRWLIKSGRLRSYAVGTREIIVMESFDDENLLTQESRERRIALQNHSVLYMHSKAMRIRLRWNQSIRLLPCRFSPVHVHIYWSCQ